MTVNERIGLLIDKMDYNFSSFSRKTGINQSAISKTVNGRNNPSFDFLEKILNAFPIVNAEWLMTGKGNMFKQNVKNIAGLIVETVINKKEDKSDYRTITILKEIIETQKLLIESLTEQIRLYKIIEENAKN
ncbi:MAG: helix-turn-helix domain-containing protein [Bacteroidales bacterium]|nr:helix-turn-helix domain-containing protein [Bacteroidales bacterium]